jgi:Protein of unknown function (DUF3352)
MQFKAKKFFQQYPLAAPIAGSALLVAGGAVVFWWITRNTFTPGTMPVGANVIPQDALMVVSLNTDLQQWRQLRQFGTPKSQAAFDQALAQLRDQIFTSNGLEYQRDILPWVGPEITIAQLSPQAELATGDSTVVPSSLSAQPLVAVLPIADPLKAKEILSAPKDLPGRQWSERTHRDIKIREAQPPANQPLGTVSPVQVAVIENRVLVVSNSARSMNRAIETYRDGKSLAQTPGYAQALGQVQQPTRPFLTLYRNIPASVMSAATNFDNSLSKQTQDWVQQSQGWATVANLQAEGIEFRNIAWLRPDSKRKFDTKNNAKSLADRMPVETLAMFDSGNLQQFWQDYSRDYVTYPIQPINPGVLTKGIQESLGMSWNEDFLQWMQGEFTFGIVPMPGDDAKKMPVGLVAMVQTNDRRAAEESLKKLDAAMATRQKYKVEPGKYNNEEVVNWSDPITGTTVTRGWMNNNIAFFALGAPVAGTFFPQTRDPLGKDVLFRQATLQNDKLSKDKPQAANGYFFVNFERVFSLSKLPPLLTWIEPYRDWLEAVRTIGMTAVTTSDRTARYDAMVLLKKSALSPGPLPAPGSSPSPKPSLSPKPKADGKPGDSKPAAANNSPPKP